MIARRVSILVAAFASLAVTGRASALDAFEIQVYDSDINDPGQFGVELHSNYTVHGDAVSGGPGLIAPNRAGHLTLETALGVTDWLELGAYLQAADAPGTGARFGGTKLRTKFVLPERAGLAPLRLGLNVELGWVPRLVEQEGWAIELRPIIGWSNGIVLVDVNPIVGFTLDGSDRFRPGMEPCAKASYNTRLGFALGLEYYAGLGFMNEVLPLRDQEHLLFAAFDLVEPPGQPASKWELNVGVGEGLTHGTGQDVLVKAIMGRTF